MWKHLCWALGLVASLRLGVQCVTHSLKWLGPSAQNSGRGFHPERDSILIPVGIVQGNHEIILNKSWTPSAQTPNKFSLLDLISKRTSFPTLPPARDPKIKIKALSVPNGSKCPADIEEWKIYHRFDNETGKCYIPAKGENPCPENMEFYLIEGDSVYGECDCKFYLGPTYRPLAYWAPGNQCYHLFDQGPCEDGEWLTLDSSQSPTCTSRRCPESEEPRKPWILHNSTCYQLSTQAFCSSSDETVQYAENDIEPHCYEERIKVKRMRTDGALTLPCQPGHKKFKSPECIIGSNV